MATPALAATAPAPLWRMLAAVLAGAGMAGMGLCGVPGWAAALATAAWGGLAAWRLGPCVLAAALPAGALLPGGGPAALIGWTLAAGALAAAARWQIAAHTEAAVAAIRHDLHDHEHERDLLHTGVERHPVLQEACLELSAAREFDQFAAALCDRALELAPEARRAAVFLATGGAEATCRTSRGPQGPLDWPLGEAERFVVGEARPLVRRTDGELILLAPLRGDRRSGGGEAPRGALAVALDGSAPGSRQSLALLLALARLGGLGLAAVDLVDQARGLALRDDLTGLFGRLEFLRRLEEQVAHCRRHGGRLGVLMCDLDHLKRFNDTWGHATGDAALRAVAAAMGAAMPPDGIACRWGGEEFAAMAPMADAGALAAWAEQVRAGVAGARPDPKRAELRVTASIGAALVQSGEDQSKLLERADAACYAAKSAGRNRVVMAP